MLLQLIAYSLRVVDLLLRGYFNTECLWCFLFYQKMCILFKKCALYLKKMQFCVCFLKIFGPLKGWYVLFENISDLATFLNWYTQGIPFSNICVMFLSNKKFHYNRVGQQFFNAPCWKVTFSLTFSENKTPSEFLSYICWEKDAVEMCDIRFEPWPHV